MKNQLLDVTIIGGGPAGLNAALVLGRARKKVTISDEGLPRNAVTHEVHDFLPATELHRVSFGELRRKRLVPITPYHS